MIRARIIAASVEGALASAVACPAYFIADQAGLPTSMALAIWASAALVFAPVTLMIRALTLGNPAAEHARHGLMLKGDGCHFCRLMRFWLPLAATPLGLAAALAYDIWGLAALGLALAALHLATALSALAEGREPHWARHTGFSFDPAD